MNQFQNFKLPHFSIIKLLFLTFAHLLICAFAHSQIVTGKVVAAHTAEPLAGATIVLKHGKAAVTQSDGTFIITLSGPADTLIVTHTGYNPKQVLVYASDLPLTITLQPVGAAMEDVVVSTGYQQIPKERATGSFAVIDNKTLNMQIGTNILDRLNGVASGILFPQKLNGPGILVRGLSTIQGPATPLIVLDNFPYEGDIANINPNDVENITILKDAAAASIWGARAGNGVIVITTKKGRFNQPLRVTLNANITSAAKPDLFAVPQISSSDFIDVEQFLFSKGYYNAEINSFYRTPLSPVVELLVKKSTGQLTAAEADAQINAYRNHDIRSDYYNYVYRSQLNQQYSVNLSAGSGNIAYT